MKLYNIFNDVILEEVLKAKGLITEGVSTQQINDVINGKFNVNILYLDYPNKPPSKRYIQVYNFSETKGGNDAIRAYQIFGGSKKKENNGYWKIFRLDKIQGWFPTRVKWLNPVSDLDPSIPKYNNDGDKTMAIVIDKVKI